MGQSYAFVGVVCVVYLLGGFILGAIALALQSVVYQLAKKPWVRVLPLTVGVILWLAMLIERFARVGFFLGGIAGALYTLFGGWVYPYDLLAFAMSTIPILIGLAVGIAVNRRDEYV